MNRELYKFLGNKFFTVVFERRHVKKGQDKIRVLNGRNNVKKWFTGKGLKFNPEKKNLLLTTDVKLKCFEVGIFEEGKLKKKVMVNSVNSVKLKENQEAKVLNWTTPLRFFSTDFRLIEVRAHGKIFTRKKLLEALNG